MPPDSTDRAHDFKIPRVLDRVFIVLWVLVAINFIMFAPRDVSRTIASALELTAKQNALSEAPEQLHQFKRSISGSFQVFSNSDLSGP